MAKRVDREGPVHMAVLHYLRLVFPDAFIHHSPNENSLSGRDRIGAAIAGARARAMGTVKGFPDLVVFRAAPHAPLFFEVKGPGGSLTDGQKSVIEWLEGLGHKVAVVRSVDDAKAALVKWGVI